MINPRPSRENATIPEGKSGRPFYGVDPGLMDGNGNLINSPGQSGHLVIRQPWPGMARTIHNNHARYKEGLYRITGRTRKFVRWALTEEAYFEQYPGYYASGDGAIVDEDGFYQVIGRRDDVINVAGHRLRTVWPRSKYSFSKYNYGYFQTIKSTSEIENAVSKHHKVAEVAVVGANHLIKGFTRDPRTRP